MCHFLSLATLFGSCRVVIISRYCEVSYSLTFCLQSPLFWSVVVSFGVVRFDRVATIDVFLRIEPLTIMDFRIDKFNAL